MTELGTAYEQAPKTGFKLNISLGKEKRSFIMFSFWENHMDYPSKIVRFAVAWFILAQSQYQSQFLSFENLYSLFDRYVPNTGFADINCILSI